MGLMDKVQDKLSSNKNHNTNTGAYDNTVSGVGNNTHGQGMVPGAHADNPSAIPTAGGQTVGGPGVHNDSNVGTGYGNAGVHQTAGDKMQNAMPGQHGNAHDAHGNPIDLSGSVHNTHGTGMTGPGHNTHTTHAGAGQGGLHQTAGDKMQNAMPGQHGNAHDAYGNPIDLSGPGHNTHSAGFTGSNTHSTGLTGSNTHNTGLTGSNTHGTGLTGSDTHNTGFTGSTTHGTHNTHNTGLTGSNTYTGPDNRGVMDKAKDTLSSNRTNQPDDPVTGTNYDQNTRNTHVGGVAGSNDPYNQTSTGLHGNNTHRTGDGLTGNTHNTTHTGAGTTHSAHNTHNTHTGPDNRGMMDKAKDMLSSKRSNQPDDPVTGTNYDQKNAHTAGGNVHHEQHGTHHTGKPSLMDKLNPKKDTDHDGKAGMMD